MDDDVTLAGVASRTFVGVSETDTLRGTGRLMADEGTQCALVMRGSDPVGVVRSVDVLDRLAADDPADAPVTDVMSEPPPTLSPTASLDDAVATLSTASDDVVVVSDGTDVHGTITARDLVAAEALWPADRAEPAPVITAAGDGPYSEQSICEGCGTLSRELTGYNGQLLCPDCRDV